MVKRKVFHQVLLKVDRSLTSTGQKFTEPLGKLCNWAEANGAYVLKIARQRESRQSDNRKSDTPVIGPTEKSYSRAILVR